MRQHITVVALIEEAALLISRKQGKSDGKAWDFINPFKGMISRTFCH